MKMASRSIDLISKIKLQVQHALFFLISKKTNMHIFVEELSYVLTQYFVSCVHVRFSFSLPLIFTQLATSISHCLTAAFSFHVFLQKNSPLLFSITRPSSFSVIHVSINIKNSVEKNTTLLLFFLFKSPGGHAISIQIKP